jgi:hypothetical protein
MTIPPNFLIASSREEDLRFGEFLAFANDLPSKQVTSVEQLQKELAANPKSLVLWDAEDSDRSIAMSEALGKHSAPVRVFAVTSQHLNAYAHLAKAPVFSHHFFRRYEEPSPTLYARLVGAAMHPAPFGLDRYFPETAEVSNLRITRSGQKRAAVDAIQAFFVKQNVNSRLAALVAQACDELIMNAVFDAPVLPNGLPMRRGTDRAVDFELIEQEHVNLQMASSDDYVGICVSDQFGSLKKSVLMNFLSKDYYDENYEVRKTDPGAGLGLHGIVQSGLSLLFLCKPGVRTEVMVFFAKGASYKTFRAGFRFLSVVAP